MLSLASGVAHAETAVWSDNFEGTTGSRWTNNGVWHIGSPTAGPALNGRFRTHSGTNCASTQKYPANRDARLVCTNYNGSSSLFVPTNGFPRLRFWHWFNFARAAGYVEVSTNSGANWNQISPTYTYAATPTSGGVWSRPSIDLSSFAGQNVQFAFHFTSGSGGNGQGWYVDDVVVVTNAPVFNNPESFEAGPLTNDWPVDFGTWEIGRPASGPKTAHTGTNCAGTVLAGNHPKFADTRLISPPFAVPGSASQTLRFWQWYNFNNALGYVEISTNGINWNQLSPTYRNGNTGGIWKNISLNLSSYAGQTVRAAFHFTSGSSTAAGWYVDDVSLVAAPVLTLPPTQTLYAGQTLAVTNSATLFPANGTPIFAVVSPTNIPTLNLNPTTGVLTWDIPTTQPAGTYTIDILATDNSTPPLSTTNSFEVIVLNPWLPVLTVPGTQTLYAGQTLTVTNSATNTFFPSSTFTFAIDSAPDDVLINPTSGVLTWPVSATQPAGNYTIGIVATDNNAPQFSATNSFTVIVSNPPPPVLTVPPTQVITFGDGLDVFVSATNSAFPGDTYAYAIDSAPAGVSIDSTTGELTWTPTSAQAPSANTITIIATDNNFPALSATGSFIVLVSSAPPAILTALPLQKISATNGFQFTLTTQPNTTWRIEASTNRISWRPLFTNTAGTSGVLQFTDLLATNFPLRFYRAVFP